MSVFDRFRQMQAQKPMTGVQENNPMWKSLSTGDKTKRYVAEGQDAINTSMNAAVSSAMPGFQDELQGIRESAIRRGVDLGDIGTRNEGTLASAFQRNMANTAGSMAQNNYQTALDRLYGFRDWQTAKDNAKAERRGATIGAIAGGVGMLAGGPLGGGIGGMVSKFRGNKVLSNVAKMGDPSWY
jgi:hypothetical protein